MISSCFRRVIASWPRSCILIASLTRSEQDQRLALEQSAGLNEAYQVLRSAPLRARYLLALRGQELALEVTVQDPEFLLQQMSLREELEDLQCNADAAGVEVFKRRLKSRPAKP